MRNSMIYLIRHAWYGNDAPPWVVAGVRALVGALITGGLSFFTIWTQTDEVRVLITAFMVPFLTVLGGRFGVEGAVDAHKKRKGQG